jgi:multiple sugar transport system ATP-binding protein
VAGIELRDVSKRYSGTSAVQHVSLSIRDGEFFVLVGPSGCGKSTLLNMIVGLEDVSAGEIRVDGERVNDIDPRDRNMAMVFQSYAIYPHMTVRENMAFPLRLAGLRKDEIDRRVNAAAGILELGNLLERRPHALSGGQRQRVAMGRAVVREPRVFLLDEPLSNLDAKLRVQMRMELARLQRRLGTTTVYVTHDQTEAMTLGDRIALLRMGEVLQVGSPRELYANPASLFVAGFLGSPAMNFLPARRAAGRLELPPGALALAQFGRGAAAVAEGPLIAGFRPEHLHLLRDDDVPGAGLVFEAQVEVVEWLGADLFIYVDVALDGFAAMSLPEDLDITSGTAAHRSLVARVDPGASLRQGDTVRLRLDADCVQLFDARNGVNLTPAGPPAGRGVA